MGLRSGTASFVLHTVDTSKSEVSAEPRCENWTPCWKRRASTPAHGGGD